MFQALVNENNMEKHLRLSMRGWRNWKNELCLKNMNQEGKSRSYVELLLGREDERGVGRY